MDVKFDSGYTKSTADLVTARCSYLLYGRQTGKWYVEFAVGAIVAPGVPIMGLVNALAVVLTAPNYCGSNHGFSYIADGTKAISGTQTAYGATYTTGDIIGAEVDFDYDVPGLLGRVQFYKNNVGQGTFTFTMEGVDWTPAIGSGSSDGAAPITATIRGGSPGIGFAYPSRSGGFLPWNGAAAGGNFLALI